MEKSCFIKLFFYLIYCLHKSYLVVSTGPLGCVCVEWLGTSDLFLCDCSRRSDTPDGYCILPTTWTNCEWNWLVNLELLNQHYRGQGLKFFFLLKDQIINVSGFAGAKGPDNKCFWICRSRSFCHNLSALSL